MPTQLEWSADCNNWRSLCVCQGNYSSHASWLKLLTHKTRRQFLWEQRQRSRHGFTLLFLYILCLPHLLSPSPLPSSAPFSGIFLRSAPLLSFPASYSYLHKDRWGTEEMKEPSSITYTRTCTSLLAQNLKIYNKQSPLLLEMLSSRLCVCVSAAWVGCVYVCVSRSGPWVLLSAQTLSLLTPPWFALDNALQSDSSLFATARWITSSIFVM